MRWAGIDKYGIVVMTGESPKITEKTTFPDEAAKVLLNPPAIVKPGKWFHNGQSFQKLPDRPSEHHVLDRKTKTWALDRVSCAKAARDKRSALLAETDWAMLSDVRLSSDVQAEYALYRQALRDLTQQEGFPEKIMWPELPQQKKNRFNKSKPVVDKK